MRFSEPSGTSCRDTKLAASFDPGAATWQQLPESGAIGYQVWRAGSLLYLNPHFGKDGGGIFDPRANVWSSLPDLPHYDLAGIIADDEATYEYASGWVLDTRTSGWRKIQPYPRNRTVYDQVIARAPALALAVFGGQTWSNGAGQLVNDLWLWTPPRTDLSE